MKLPRLITRRRVKWVGTSIVLGWAVATTVALACAIWSDTSSKTLIRAVPSGRVWEYRGPGLVEVNTQLFKALDDMRYMDHWTVKAGFPFTMYQRSVSRLEAPGLDYWDLALSRPPTRLAEGVMITRDDHLLRGVTRFEPIILPVVPIATGIIANSLLYGGAIFMVCTLPMLFRRTPKPWQCAKCRYDLRGLGGVRAESGKVDSETRPTVCPECGSVVDHSNRGEVSAD